ncbi:MAG: hypothetical protein GY827_04570 [Cytophagales bacterium]|nr:hypothetical protein [Cytophagales bacterium]
MKKTDKLEISLDIKDILDQIENSEGVPGWFTSSISARLKKVQNKIKNL